MKKTLYSSVLLSMLLFMGCDETKDKPVKSGSQLNSSSSSSALVDNNSTSTSSSTNTVIDNNSTGNSSSCSGSGNGADNSAEVDKNERTTYKNLWESKNIKNYTYEYSWYTDFNAYSNPSANATYKITVIDSVAVSSINLDTNESNTYTPDTIDSLFVEAGTVTYNSEYGYVSSHSYSIKCAYDSTSRFSISNFTILDENNTSK